MVVLFSGKKQNEDVNTQLSTFLTMSKMQVGLLVTQIGSTAGYQG